MTAGDVNPSEEGLARRIRGGEPGAFDEFFDCFAGPLLAYLDGMVRDRSAAEDLLQETLLRVYQRIDRYREQGAFRAWVFRIATNIALTELRRRRISTAVPLDEEALGRPARGDPGPEAREELERRERSLAAGLESLPEDQRTVILLRVRGGMGIRDIARALRVPEGTVKSRIHHAVRRLREFARNRERSGETRNREHSGETRRQHGCVR